MPLYRDEAVVLRTHQLGEADRIITALTRSRGKIRTVAKGVRRTSSRFGARLEPFMVADVQLYQGRTLDIVQQAESLAGRLEAATAAARTACGQLQAVLHDFQGSREEMLGWEQRRQQARQLAERLAGLLAVVRKPTGWAGVLLGAVLFTAAIYTKHSYALAGPLACVLWLVQTKRWRIGGGNTAVDEAVYLSDLCKKVYLVHRRKELRAESFLQERAFARPNLEFVWDSVPTQVLGTGEVSGLRVQNKNTLEERDIPLDGVFVAIGHEPQTEWLAGVVALENGFIVTDCNMATSAPGIFAAGDIRNTPLRQITTAVGDASIAAYSAWQYVLRTR